MRLNLNNSELKICAGSIRQFPRSEIPQVAMAGRSNVGKSSLVNSLLCRKSLARVSNKPGKTITVNFYMIDSKLFLVDLPGYGYAKRSAEEQAVWSELTDGYFTANPNIGSLKLVLLLVDSRIGMTDNDAAMADYLKQTGLPFVVILTKSDKLKPSEKEKIRKEVQKAAEADVIMYSSVSGEGKADVWESILHYAEI